MNAKDGTRDLVAEGQSIGGREAVVPHQSRPRGNWKEGFECGREVSPHDPEWALSAMVDGNYWPRDEVLPGFREAMLGYRTASKNRKCTNGGFFVGLGLPSNFFVEKTRRAMATMRLVLPRGRRAGYIDPAWLRSHTDYGLCTLAAEIKRRFYSSVTPRTSG